MAQGGGEGLRDMDKEYRIIQDTMIDLECLANALKPFLIFQEKKECDHGSAFLKCGSCEKVLYPPPPSPSEKCEDCHMVCGVCHKCLDCKLCLCGLSTSREDEVSPSAQAAKAVEEKIKEMTTWMSAKKIDTEFWELRLRELVSLVRKGEKKGSISSEE